MAFWGSFPGMTLTGTTGPTPEQKSSVDAAIAAGRTTDNTSYIAAFTDGRLNVGNNTDVGYQYNQPNQFRPLDQNQAVNNPSLTSAIEEAKIPLASKVTAAVADIQSKSATALRFPANLGNGTSGNIFPFIQFVAKVKKEGNYAVFLPIPSGLTFSDNMQYSSLDLGIMGNIVSKTVGAAVNQSNLFSGVGAGIGAGVGTIVNQIKSTNAAAAASIATRFVGSDNLANAVDFGAKQIISPNTNTAFQNSGVRQFQFSFKMMPKDKKEADTITQIVRLFRQNMYPEANDLILTYPPVWNIDFFNGHDPKKNTKLPGIHACYLIAMSAVYNSSGNMFHADGHPVETDVQLTFEETRALTFDDIEKLSEGRDA